MSTITPHAVKITKTPERDGHFDVWPMFTGVDHPARWGWEVTSMEIAGRLSEALMDNAIFDTTEVKVGADGKTFVLVNTDRVGASTMEADLTRLGY